VQGGGPAALNRFAWQDESGAWQSPPLASKIVGIRLAPGRRARLETPGGGGWGDPRERDAATHTADVAAGLVTR
jgi:N-methylhydantoinase B